MRTRDAGPFMSWESTVMIYFKFKKIHVPERMTSVYIIQFVILIFFIRLAFDIDCSSHNCFTALV
jgi:hypothetical protein